MKVGKRQSAAAGIAVAALLGVAACGSDNNSGGGGSTPSAAGTSAATISCATGSVSGSGSSAQKNAMDQWVKDYTAKCSGAQIQYASVGSGAGRTAFIAKQVDFAGSDSALADPQKAQADAVCTGGSAIDIPTVAGPITLIYNLSGVSTLKLSPSLVAKIFSNTITKWDDPAIKAENAGVSLPSTPIQSIHRSDSSGTTDNFSKFLHGAAAADYPTDHSSDWKAPGGQGAKGSDGITSVVKSTAGAIGYVEESYADNAGLPTAEIKNANGEYVKASTDAASKGLSTATVADGNDLKVTFDYTSKVAGAYPIYLISYEIVCTAGQDPAKAGLVKSFLTYATSDAGQSSITDLGYSPLPSSLATKVRGVIATLP
ncbi:phosphate ABC transporter substrate-binding protein PstS [Frankia sp. AgB1.9]|uniref:phosphate ABC transporter substrate-binding protein PstS n=1 Tax=unclassified Frankia TaxID=2632575 RepID=UPI0019322C64|nr:MULTISPECIES: phosphate ABC transporter substrate-binding protein PstS [unclassified Frankia]MBL7492102.1 phosphate ABC transporter substrate-binding protein PstS [Frankia sp. AgW1.1]MBL7551739.1 phosphate ABC transporter substrate-binding protein PstS [Frankia sp. AgB1.9]MBL7621313.1 phosphate ABC transporter substrate-binding protein PstS [Frankia sp. AgB1.8]